MKKALVFLLVPLLLILAGLPFAHGKMAARVNQEILANANNSSGYGAVEIVEHSSGYSGSQTKFKWSAPAIAANEGIAVVLCNTSHGITGYTQTCHIEEPAAYKNWVDENLNGVDPITFELAGNLIGKFRTSVQLEPFSYRADDGTTFEIEAGKVVGSGKMIGAINLDFEGKLAGMSIVNDEGTMKLGSVDIDGDMLQRDQLSFGAAKASIASMEFTDAEQNIAFDNVTFNYDVPDIGDKMKFSYGVFADKVNVVGADQDDIALSAAEFTFEAGGLDRETLNTLIKTYRESTRALAAGGSSEPDMEAMMQLQQDLMAQMQLLLVKDAYMDMDSSVSVDGEPLVGNVRVALNQTITEDDILMAMMAPLELLNKTNIDLNFSMTEKFVKSLDDQQGLQAMTDSSFLVSNNGTLEFNGSVRDGLVVMNGNETSIEQAMSEFMAASMGASMGSANNGEVNGLDLEESMSESGMTEEEMAEMLELIKSMEQ